MVSSLCNKEKEKQTMYFSVWNRNQTRKMNCAKKQVDAIRLFKAAKQQCSMRFSIFERFLLFQTAKQDFKILTPKAET